MDRGAKAAERELASWDEGLSEDSDDGFDFFSLSGGVIGPAKTSNRIDGLLGKMLVSQNFSRYLGDVDKNLDYLYTSLQLDLIERVAKDVSSVEEDEPREEAREEPETVVSLDKVRLSI